MPIITGRIYHPHRLSLKELLNVYFSKKKTEQREKQQGRGIKEPNANSIAD